MRLTPIFVSIFALFLAACSGEGSSYIRPPNPYAGIWMGRETNQEMRKTKSLESNCNQMKTDGFVSAIVIDKNGNVYDYEIDTNSKDKLEKAGTITRDGKLKITRGTGVEAQASLQGDALTITVVSPSAFHLHFSRSTREEVAGLGALKTLCKLDQLTGNL